MRKASSFALFCTQSSLPGLVVTLSRLLSVGHQEPVVDGESFSRWGGIFISLVTSFWSSPSWGGAGDAVATLSPLHLQVAEAWGVTVSTPQCFPGCQTVISVSAHSFRKLTTLPPLVRNVCRQQWRLWSHLQGHIDGGSLQLSHWVHPPVGWEDM